jgi:hypothetical protein
VTRAYVAATANANADCSFKSPCATIHQAIATLKTSGTVTIIESGDYDPFEIGRGLIAGSGSEPVRVTLSNSTITQNRVGVEVQDNATVFTYNNNKIDGNGFYPDYNDNVRGKLTYILFH